MCSLCTCQIIYCCGEIDIIYHLESNQNSSSFHYFGILSRCLLLLTQLFEIAQFFTERPLSPIQWSQASRKVIATRQSSFAEQLFMSVLQMLLEPVAVLMPSLAQHVHQLGHPVCSVKKEDISLVTFLFCITGSNFSLSYVNHSFANPCASFSKVNFLLCCLLVFVSCSGEPHCSRGCNWGIRFEVRNAALTTLYNHVSLCTDRFMLSAPMNVSLKPHSNLPSR